MNRLPRAVTLAFAAFALIVGSTWMKVTTAAEMAKMGPVAAAPVILSSRVYEAEVGDETWPLASVTVPLYSSNKVPDSPSSPNAEVHSALTAWTFSGKVYRGQPGDYSTPLSGVTVAIYGAHSTGRQGTYIRETTTNRSGAFSLTVWDDDGSYEYYNIIETDPPSYISTGAISGSGGEVVTASWIRFHNPSPGTYAENFFWDTPILTDTPTSTSTVIPPTHTPTLTHTPTGPTYTPTPIGPDIGPTSTPTSTPTTVLPTRTATPTSTPTQPTRTATPTHTPPVEVIRRTFSGVVYLGEPGDRTHPLPDIPVHLLKAAIHCEIGTLVMATLTNQQGRFVLEALMPTGEDEPYLNLALGAEDIHVAGAESESGARLTGEGWLQFEWVGSGTYDGNEFFVKSLVGQRLLTFPADADAHISKASPNSNYGNSSTLRTSYTAAGTPMTEQALLFFDLSAIHWSTEVQKATLHVYLQEAGGDDKVCMAVHAIQEEWCEGPLCWLLPPVTWNKQPSHALAASADHIVGPDPGYRVWDVTRLVQEWVSHPAWNYGMALLGEEKGTGWTRIFSSREGSNPPYLTVYVPLDTRVVTPTPTKSPTPIALDLQVDAIEVTQSIQCKDNPNCPDNAVPMIAGKMTFARVYIKVNGSTYDVPNVSARAIAKVGGQQLTAWAINPTITAKLIPDRAQFNDTLNFYLHGVSSSGTLEVEVNPFGTIPESNYTNNKKTVNLNFVTTPPLRIVPIWIYYTAGGQKEIVDRSMPGNLQGYLKKVLPVGDIQWFLLSIPVLPWDQAIGPDQGSWSTLLAKINDLRNKNTSLPSDAHWYGMIPFKMPQGSICGLGYMPGYAAIGRVPVHHENLEDTADIAAHELGHNFNRGHAPCGLPDGEVAAPYPYADAIIGDYGWDWNFAAGGKVPSYPNGYVVPKSSYDLMTYCQDEWVSEYTYRAILSYRGSTVATAGNAGDTRTGTQKRSPQRSSTQLQPHLFASGSIDPSEASLDPWSVLEQPVGSHDEPGAGPYQLRLIAGNGAISFERHFDVQSITHTLLSDTASLETQVDSRFFYEILPWHPDTARIQIWQGEQLLAERAVSAHAPAVELTSPQGGELWLPDEQYSVAWHASDLDSAELWFDVAFSRDDGQTWEFIATHLLESELLVRGDQFPGTENARVRVYASDGVRTSVATSAAFAVVRKPPLVFITTPENGLVVPPGAVLLFSGFALDREDDPAASLPMHWHSDRDGMLGSGSEIMARSLSPGWHEITLTATDSDGMEGSASVLLYIGYNVSLPIVTKTSPQPQSIPFEDLRLLHGWTPNCGTWTNPGNHIRGQYTWAVQRSISRKLLTVTGSPYASGQWGAVLFHETVTCHDLKARGIP